jgi:predicted Fe-Mo cluster-binding NifX family protein
MAADGVQVVLTDHCGPNAFRALQAAGIRVYTGLKGGSVCEAVERFKAGALQEATAADVQGHW